VESIILSCLESKNDEIVDHLLRECDLIGKIIKTEKQPILSGDKQPTLAAAGKQAPRVGNVGHISRISNKLVQLSTNSNQIKTLLEENNDWGEWEANTLHDRNAVENVYRWVCGRPTALHDRTRDSDDDEVHDRDYDLAGLANNLNQFRYNMQENNGAGEEHGSNDRDEEDVYFDDESAEVVISSLRLGDEQANNLFTNSNWFTFQGDELGENTGTGAISSEEAMEDVSLNETSDGGDEEDEDEDCLITESKNPFVDSTAATASTSEAVSVDADIEIDEDVGTDELSPEWVERNDSSSAIAPGSTDDVKMPDVRIPNGSSSSEGEISPRSPPVPSLFGKDVEFVGVEPEGTERAMDQALKEGIVGEAGPMKRNTTTASPGKESPDDSMQEYNDTNYWKVDQEVTVVE
jgi:serine/threonine-protein phosphatase 6 regulatory subunit 3